MSSDNLNNIQNSEQKIKYKTQDAQDQIFIKKTLMPYEMISRNQSIQQQEIHRIQQQLMSWHMQNQMLKMSEKSMWLCQQQQTSQIQSSFHIPQMKRIKKMSSQLHTQSSQSSQQMQDKNQRQILRLPKTRKQMQTDNFVLSKHDRDEQELIKKWIISHSSITNIDELQNLQQLKLSFYNQLKTIKLTKFQKLKKLTISQSSITNIDELSNLEQLQLSFCRQLKTIKLTKCQKLKKLTIKFSAIKNVQLKKLLNLQTLSFTFCNQLQIINLTQCDNLQQLKFNSFSSQNSFIKYLKENKRLFLTKNKTGEFQINDLQKVQNLSQNHIQIQMKQVQIKTKQFRILLSNLAYSHSSYMAISQNSTELIAMQFTAQMFLIQKQKLLSEYKFSQKDLSNRVLKSQIDWIIETKSYIFQKILQHQLNSQKPINQTILLQKCKKYVDLLKKINMAEGLQKLKYKDVIIFQFSLFLKENIFQKLLIRNKQLQLEFRQKKYEEIQVQKQILKFVIQMTIINYQLLEITRLQVKKQENIRKKILQKTEFITKNQKYCQIKKLNKYSEDQLKQILRQIVQNCSQIEKESKALQKKSKQYFGFYILQELKINITQDLVNGVLKNSKNKEIWQKILEILT